jgi:hypothetical protein
VSSSENVSATVKGKGRGFRILWGFNALIAAIFLFFFFWGLADGRVSSFNIMLWLGVLAALAAILGSSLALRAKGHTRPAVGLLLILAIPGMLGVLFFLAVLILHPRWN